MGYTTSFHGKFLLNKRLSAEDKQWLEDFSEEIHEQSDGFPYGYYCQWVPSSDGNSIRWDGGEKFYSYTQWIEWLLDHFFIPKGYVLNGSVTWNGEENEDMGKIIIKNNIVTIKKAKITFD